MRTWRFSKYAIQSDCSHHADYYISWLTSFWPPSPTFTSHLWETSNCSVYLSQFCFFLFFSLLGSNYSEILSFSDVSLSIISIRLDEVVENGKISILWLNNILCVCVYAIFYVFIHLLMDTYVASMSWHSWITLQ